MIFAISDLFLMSIYSREGEREMWRREGNVEERGRCGGEREMWRTVISAELISTSF